MGDPEPLRALSVRQPWPFAICRGKTPENRTWRTGHRGPLAVHASAGWDDDADRRVISWIREQTAATAEQIRDMRSPGHRSVVVAVVDLVGCHRAGDVSAGCHPDRLCSVWAARDQWHWMLENVRVLPEPVPCGGALGLWRLPPHVDDKVRAQVAI